MFLIILLYLVLPQKCISFDLPSTECISGLKINDNNYVKTKVYDIGDARPSDIHYDTFGNLFYVESGGNEKGYYYNVQVIKSKQTAATPEKIPGLPSNVSYSIAVDNKSSKVYFGTKLGMYAYNYESNNATPTIMGDFEIDMVLVDKEGNKFITVIKDGIQELYLLDGEKKTPFKSLNAFNEMEIDTKNNFYFIRDETLYVLKSNLTEPINIGNVNYYGTAQIAIYNNNIFIASGKLAYIHENDTGNLKYAENAPDNITSVAFDSYGDFMLGTYGQLLKYNKRGCEPKTSRVVDELSKA